MAIKYTHQDACQPLRERIAELEQELSEVKQVEKRYELHNVKLIKENAHLKADLNNMTQSYLAGQLVRDQLKEQVQSQQAKIDALMLEYCPNDMTPEQLEDWGRNQKPVDDSGKVIDE